MDHKFASKFDELDHLLSLADVEMSLLSRANDHLLRMLRVPLPVKQCRDLLPWKGGKSLVSDFEKLAGHCTRIAQLLKDLESEQEAS